MIQNDAFDAVVDVRTVSEWEDTGIIENVTLIESMQSLSSTIEYCSIAVYCRSGSRAQSALEKMQNEFGFKGPLFNGLGTSQWIDAGYPLVPYDNSSPTTNAVVVPPCSTDGGVSEQCRLANQDPCELECMFLGLFAGMYIKSPRLDCEHVCVPNFFATLAECDSFGRCADE
eukprot:CAMPEP_0118682708 /NCGR_PEP_ID=MMETSP0800-20121206/5628_1 /TAXON_ID=210618 ORGANISM="Striatella unipunctata, Strain CCMP2910" /NCGR_SAMPLE_ID=MMETSP0800 /ASSEMBLY_ACC=CAM_ASM_000638 /LENGTH=171 /DNA_ID=CAMNT_0006579113 /DNA_START=163 /DNA_END=679 /DNA_ORIENTATION=-